MNKYNTYLFSVHAVGEPDYKRRKFPISVTGRTRDEAEKKLRSRLWKYKIIEIDLVGWS